MNPQAMGIQIEQLRVSYGQQRVVDELTLDITQGQFFTLLGPSGCGKTTLLRCIAGFVPVQSGRILFARRDMTHVPAHQRDIGMVFQDYALFPHLTVFDNVAYGLRARRVDAAALQRKTSTALERVGLAHLGARLPAVLSGGQRQRVALARAMVIEPQVLLMDEPLSNLDAKLRVQMRETIAELQREVGITTVFVTHDQEEALALSDKVAVMNQGRIEQLGSPRNIYEEPASAYVADFIGGANLLPVACTTPASSHVNVNLQGHTVRACAPVAVDGAALLVARPEDILFAGADQLNVTGPPAHIRGVQYLGVKTSYRVALASGQVLSVDVHGEPRAGLDKGAAVMLHFDPSKVRVLPA